MGRGTETRGQAGKVELQKEARREGEREDQK